jgi:DNA polymerase-3 subunit alpha
MPQFSHLHVHTQYSLLDGQASINALMKKAQTDGMRAMAITDHGNMFGAFEFVNAAKKHNILPVVGCEFYVVDDRHNKKFTKEGKDIRHHQLLLAKNQQGYENLSKLCSLGYIEGLYSKWPRIDLELIHKYKEGLIATTCCIGAQVPQTILTMGEAAGEKMFLKWLEIFGDDYYIEIQRHNLMNINNSGLSQEDINQILLKWSKKYNVPAIATNDTHYVNQDDFNAHDILLCVNTGEKQATPKGDGKGFRFGFENDQFYFKTQAEMLHLFRDVPQTIDNTNLIVDKITPPILSRDILLPNYILPPGYATQADYLQHLTFEGARNRYGEITAEIEERLSFELKVINESGYPGYFLIVQDFIAAARKLGVWVGPGRGSAAGSAIAYCTGITNVDPIKYDLLFERFLNPERVSMPDIDIDFDDEGREKVIDYVVKKYGYNQVAQIITYGTMATKSSVKDVGRVLDMPLSDVDKITKAIPDNPKATLNTLLAQGDISPELKEELNTEQLAQAYEFRKLSMGDTPQARVLKQAVRLEGSVRNTGIHACGIVITPDDITKYVPVTVAKDTKDGSESLLVTQFENSVMESAGLLKMDFLGLKTLTIMRDAVALIQQRHSISIDIDTIDLADKKTYELFQRGETNGIFQFESPGMQKHLKALKPDCLDDLIAMNALYRPGPLAYIPNFIDRKQGREPITYDIPVMEKYLKDTYGITVYQEQIMLLSQLMANFTKGEADVLRKAMGKKQKSVMDKMFVSFIEGCKANGHPEATVKKVWNDWEAFASYAFNKSHSTCYAVLAFQTAYLKAHYPAEFMAAVLTHNMSDLKSVSFFMEETKRMGIPVLSPDANESDVKFMVNEKSAIRFALSAIKGVGEAAVSKIVEERKENGHFKNIFDFATRMDSKAVNKRVLESLVYGGAFDSDTTLHRAQYFYTDANDGQTLIEKAIKYGAKMQIESASAQNNLFGSSSDTQNTDNQNNLEPKAPQCEEWSLIEKLKYEKEVVGIYISAHPLDEYKLEIENFCTCTIADMQKFGNQPITIAGTVTNFTERTSQKGSLYGMLTIEDYSDTIQLMLFGESYLKLKHYLQIGNMLYIAGKMQPRYNNPQEQEIRIENIELLSSIRQKKLHKITLNISLKQINPALIHDLKNLTTTHKGNVKLCLQVSNADTKQVLNLYSNMNINASTDFLNAINTLSIDGFGVN